MRFGLHIPVLAFLAMLPSSTVHGEDPAARVLTSGSLSVEVMDPNHPDRYNRGVRFTPVAAVLRANLNGRSYLYAPADHDPVVDHGGLAAEFDLCIPGGPEADLPPGYEEAAVGEGFLKVGVGVLRKGKKTYNFFQKPELIESAKTTVQWSPDSAAFRQTCGGVNGYAYELAATVTVRDNAVFVDWKLTNTGTKALVTKQYTHNFFRFGDHDIGDGYILSFPHDFQAECLESGQKQIGRDILFVGAIRKWINALVRPPADYAGPNAFLLRDTVTGQSVRCETSVPGLFTAIHARTSYVAPEQFIAISLAPGETKTWSRSYAFMNGKASLSRVPGGDNPLPSK